MVTNLCTKLGHAGSRNIILKILLGGEGECMQKPIYASKNNDVERRYHYLVRRTPHGPIKIFLASLVEEEVVLKNI